MKQRNGRPEISAYALAHILIRSGYYQDVHHAYARDNRDGIYEQLICDHSGEPVADLRNRRYGVEWTDFASGRVKEVQDGWCEEMMLTA